MNIIGKLIELALVACCDAGVIDWYPGDGEPETFLAECEISQNYHPAHDGFPAITDFIVILDNVFCMIDGITMECWHSSKMEVLA